MQVWKDAARLVTDQQRPELNAVVAASYGAALLLWTGYNGVVMHLWSPDSGTGKSTALHVAQAVWGSTSKLSKIADTPNAVNNKLGQLRNVPLIYDELKKGNDKKLVDLIMQVQAGATKERLNRSSHAMPIYTWQTMLISAGNSPLHGYLAEYDPSTVAGINRVWEVRAYENVKGIGMIEHTVAQRLIGSLQSNCGHAGLEYSKFLGANIDLVRDNVARMQDAVNNAVKGTTNDRFWIAEMAVTLCGAKYANHLNHTAMNIDQLAGFMTEQLQEQRGSRRHSANNLTNREGVERLLSDFIGGNRDRMLMSEHVWRNMGHPPTGWNIGHHNVFDVRNKSIVGRVASVDGFVRIGLSALTGWTKKERDLGKSELLVAIREHIPGVKFIKADLASNTEIKGIRQDVIDLDLSLLPGFFDFN
jgi:hypothetical protein